MDPTERGRRPRVLLLLGDPSGIGPEVAAKLLALPETLEHASVTIVGDRRIYRDGVAAAGAREIAASFVEHHAAAYPYRAARASVRAGEYVLESLRIALGIVKGGSADAIVFAPLNKQAMKLAGLKEDDELHYFASILDHSGTVSEINVCGNLWTSRVTSHVPLREVAALITADKICAAAELLNRVIESSGVEAPRLAVAALNPHAGEGGKLGTEEITVISPAVERLRAAGIDASGPLPADTLFIAARRGDYDGVVTMYHDQGQIALKLMGFDKGVTVAGGLPVVITTPAHGTAFDITGKGIADVGPIRQAFAIACRMAAARQSASL